MPCAPESDAATLLEALAAARDQHEIPAGCRQLLGKGLADPGRRSGDHRHARHFVPSTPIPLRIGTVPRAADRLPSSQCLPSPFRRHSRARAACSSERFGLSDFRPGQAEVIEALLAGRSALAVFPTGSGKSLCYQLPALLLDGVTVVVSPLIALMKDQIDALEALGVAAARIDSSLSLEELRDVSARLRRGELRLLYVAPERFNNERFVAQLAGVDIALFAVDEAHCISEWGHNFRPDYLKLAQRARELGAARVLALTATATPAVVDDICAGFGIEPADAVATGAYRPNLTLLMTPVAAAERDRAPGRAPALAAARLGHRLRHAAAHGAADRRAAGRRRACRPGPTTRA